MLVGHADIYSLDDANIKTDLLVKPVLENTVLEELGDEQKQRERAEEGEGG